MIVADSTQKLIEAVEKADSAEGLLDAVEALSAARDEAAIPTLIEVLRFNNPGAAVAAVEGLIDLQEVAVPHLLQQIDDYNYGARAWAIRALAGIGDPAALDILLKAASTDFSLSVRRAAARGLGNIRWLLLDSQKAFLAQSEVLDTLLLVCQDGEWVVRYAAVVGLESLANTFADSRFDLMDKILQQCQEMLQGDPELVVRARIKMALEQL
ncbi:MAG: HEAT repeat domain-containing protein [Prochloron sp. SP5CPC1]|nr:HEAT repeat domain-containing protein [Candidatus Paraprochloron terpiosi SP5CPC1]